jgi:uncharacterized protein (DUF1800 family)
LQELFTVGKDSPITYTEDDVVAAARVLTGWRINFTDVTSYFEPTAHDAGFKVFSSYYNGTIIPGSSNGEQELDALLDMIFQKEESQIRCRSLPFSFLQNRRDGGTDIIATGANFRDNYEIKPVMAALPQSEHF